MPPIVVEGRTDNHNNLKKDLQSIVKGKYTIKYTSNSTILYLEDEQDHKNLLASFREAKISHHSYTSRAEKSHAFVLRGIAEGTTLEQIEEDLMLSYDIKIRDSYKMSTKNRPLFLIVTDPAITLDFLNKNIRVVENTRVVWELRKSVKRIFSKLAFDSSQFIIKYFPKVSPRQSKLFLSEEGSNPMPKPDRAPQTPTEGFETQYMKKVRNRCRLDVSGINKVSHMSTPQNIKRKVKINPVQNVSRYRLPLTAHTNTGTKQPVQGEPLFNLFSERPSNNPEESNLQGNQGIAEGYPAGAPQSDSELPLDKGNVVTENPISMEESNPERAKTPPIGSDSEGNNADYDMDTEKVSSSSEESDDSGTKTAVEVSPVSSPEIAQTGTQNQLNPTLENFNSAYVTVAANDELKITIKATDVPESLRNNIMNFNVSESQDKELGLKQTVHPEIHQIPEQPEMLTLPTDVPNKPKYPPPKPKDPENPEPKTKRIQEITSPNKNREDYDNVLHNIKQEEVPYHTYTANADKSHAFVIRGLGEGTLIEDLEEEMETEHEIKLRAAYQMSTKNRPLFLVITDPSITLEYLNKNIRVILNTRITWELRKSNKQNSQETLEKAYDALTEPEDQADSEGSGNISPNTSKESTESTENTDTIIRSDPNESLENLINTLENSSDSSENSDNGNRTVLEMDEDNNGVETPKSIKKSTHFSEPQKYGENFENYNSGYMTLQMPEQVIARSLNFMQNSTPSEDGTITPKLIREKSKKTITTTQNKFQALTDMSESESSEYEDEIKKIVKRKRKMRKQREENPDNNVAQTHTNASNVVKPTEITKTSTKPNTIQNTPKKRQQCHL
ncbi:unnamed protein product [Psylliodes chrysocephalus]|uniref:Uncharacterized protein n=1 Tax=Psylliodes chrysocephalus TaxID=3402493 RepID=A0A9P0D2B2_9CUCU|nr:unnamed protein product [Psylliodes chrysocephala]